MGGLFKCALLGTRSEPGWGLDHSAVPSLAHGETGLLGRWDGLVAAILLRLDRAP